MKMSKTSYYWEVIFYIKIFFILQVSLHGSFKWQGLQNVYNSHTHRHKENHTHTHLCILSSKISTTPVYRRSMFLNNDKLVVLTFLHFISPTWEKGSNTGIFFLLCWFTPSHGHSVTATYRTYRSTCTRRTQWHLRIFTALQFPVQFATVLVRL